MADNFFTATGSLDRNQVLLFDRSVDVMFMARNELAGVALGEFFDKQTKSEGLTHIIANVTSNMPLPVENQDTEALMYFTPAPGLKKTITLINYRAGVRVTDTIMRAERYSKVVEMASGQMKATGRLDEYLRASLFNNSMSGTAGADSLSLCHDSHPHENVEAGTWDNKGTGAFSRANFQALRLLARKMTDPQGDPDWQMPKAIIFPEDLEEDVEVLLKTTKKQGTALNDVAWGVQGIKPVVSPYLSSAVQYFLACDRTGEEKGLHEVVLEDWNIANRAPDPDIPINKRVKAIKAFDFTRSKNILGSTGA